MLYPTTEYAYIDENGQSVEPPRYLQHSYPESSEQPSSQFIFEDNNVDNTQQQQVQYRPIVIDGSQPLAKCSVLYLGTAISSPGQRGIDAIQEPLSRRYPVDGKEVVRGIEAWLSIYDNGLQLQFARDPSVVLFYPIRSLVYCASIRFATRTQTGAEFPNGWRFVPLDSPAAARVENTRNPPLFAVTFRRSRHLPVDECHCFVTKTRQAALALVQACFSAYQATVPQQDCSKVPLYFKVDDYGSKNKEIDHEIRIVPAPDRERTLDYLTNTEGAGFFYKTDRVPIDTWQLWEHHKHDLNRDSRRSHPSMSRSSSRKSSHSRSSSSSSSCSSSFSSCSSCHRNRRSRSHRRKRRRRRLASIASISAAQQQKQSQTQQQSTVSRSESQSISVNTVPTSVGTSAQQTAQNPIDPYAPAPNLVRVERMKDVNSGQEVFIRWITEPNVTSASNDDQQSSTPQQVYSTQPPNDQTANYDYQNESELPTELERLVLSDEHLRKSLLFDERPPSIMSNYEQKKYKKRSKREKDRTFDNQNADYEVVNGFYEDRRGKRRPVKLDRTHINTVKDYRHMFNDMVNATPSKPPRRHPNRATSLIRPPVQEQQHFPSAPLSVSNQTVVRPFGTTFLPFNSPFYAPKQPFNTTPLFPRANFLNRVSLARPSLWYRPM